VPPTKSFSLATLYHRLFVRASIRLKLFYAMLAVVVVLICAVGAATHYIFNRDFLGYLNEQAQQRMEDLVPKLEQAYRNNGSWDFIRNEPREWFILMKPVMVEHDELYTPATRPMLPTSDLTGATLRFSLLDAKRNLIIGFPYIGPAARLRPIMYDNDIVGWIAQTPFENVIGSLDVRFEQSQMLAQLIIGLIAIMVVGIIVIRIANVLLRPLVRVARATHKLAGGDYTIRVPVSSEDEVGRLANDFNQLATTLERNEKLRREFMADVSHELRTPLGILNGQLEALEDGVLQPDAATVGSLKSEVEHLNKLVNDLYDLSLADAGALTYRKSDIDLGALLHTTLHAYEDRFRKRGLLLGSDTLSDNTAPMPIHADAGRLLQLFNNLCENSLRYTDAIHAGSQGRLLINTRHDSQQQRWIVQLDDSAPGVEGAALARLFERFFRVDASRNRASGGAGLGLAICQRIVQAHQGSIHAEASPLGGLRVVISLPVAEPTASPTDHPGNAP
jgi:two-component system sensor histidine kinase BaeS